MADSKSFTQLEDVGEFTSEDVFALSHKASTSAWVSRKASLAAIGLAILNALQYEALETDSKKIIEAINALNRSNQYDFTEKLIGSYDGKPLYRKVIDCGNLPDSTTKTISHGIAHLGQLVKNEVIVTLASGTSFSTPYVPGNFNGSIFHTVTQTTVNIVTASNRSTAKAIAVLEYIKEA